MSKETYNPDNVRMTFAGRKIVPDILPATLDHAPRAALLNAQRHIANHFAQLYLSSLEAAPGTTLRDLAREAHEMGYEFEVTTPVATVVHATYDPDAQPSATVTVEWGDLYVPVEVPDAR